MGVPAGDLRPLPLELGRDLHQPLPDVLHGERVGTAPPHRGAVPSPVEFPHRKTHRPAKWSDNRRFID